MSDFHRGRTSTGDEPRSGRPQTATNDEIVDKLHDVVLVGRGLKIKEIAKTAVISAERVGHILYESMKKLSTRWLPHLVTLEHGTG